jgi:hypothetical protein
MSLTVEKVYLFDMQWTDDADYEHIFEDRLHDTMIPFFAFGEEATFSREVDYTSSYKPVAKIYAKFITEASKYKFMLKYSDKLNELR